MKKRVKIPMRDAAALLALATKVREKHVEDGDASPLKVMNWAEIGPIIDDAVQTEETAMNLKREKLRVYQQRISRLNAVAGIMRNTRDILTGVHSVDMKTLGRWGFDVLDNRVTVHAKEESTTTKV